MERFLRSVKLLLVAAAFLFIPWLVFVGTFDKWELLLGAVVALLAASALGIVQHAEGEHARARLRDVAQVVYVPFLLLQGTWDVLFAGMRDLLGGRPAVSAFRIVEFEGGELEDPRAAGRRVLAVLYLTISPNDVAIGINVRERQMLIHEIERSEPPRMLKNLGART